MKTRGIRSLAATPHKLSGVIYRILKRGKIRWAELSRIPPNVVIRGKTFAVHLRLPHLNNVVIRSLYNINKYSRENFRGALENRETRKFSPANLSPFTVEI